ncbi:MAG: hypothetical protein PHR87_14230 [Sulfurospirillaceae bacterium]|nr:hypothetical protein [Sulfurospirillaceae bacterium]
MKANFDNMRIFTTGSMNAFGEVLQDEILSVSDSYYIDDDLKRKIVNAFNHAAQRINALNCLFDDNIQDDVNDLSDDIEVGLLKLEDKEEDDDEL